MTAAVQTGKPVRLTGDELEVARAEVDAVRNVVAGGDYRARLDQIAVRLDEGVPLDVDDEQELDRLLMLALQSGRARALYGPGGEQAALKAFRKLPSGRELAATVADVTRALESLAGKTLDRVSIGANGPGAFTLSIAADGTQLSIRLDRQGARLASVEA